MKEMVGGCCVCSDERGWPDNPLVYCDGNGCNVAVHQACYGIVSVPTGPWYCRKCESPDVKGKVKCELCPSKAGALKRADTGGWAHVVCALYIPEVRFGNVTSMEPIVLRLIPPERYNKICYVCQDSGKSHRANAGACMQCNKSGCKQQFHVTCAQSLGLLCEEAGNYLDNVKYCGYCQHHYSKLKKGGNVKTIPPYKPISHDGHSSDSSGEKEGDASPMATGGGTPTHSAKSKGPGRKSSSANPSSGKSTPTSSKTPTTPVEIAIQDIPTPGEVTTVNRKHKSSDKTAKGHHSSEKSKKPSPSRRGSSAGDAVPTNLSGSKSNTPAPSPQHISTNDTPPANTKAPGSSTPGGSTKATPPSSSPSGTRTIQEAVGVISSVASALAVASTTSTVTTSTITAPSVVLSTSTAKTPQSYPESVITNTDVIENKQTKKRKAVAAAAASQVAPVDYTATATSQAVTIDSATAPVWENSNHNAAKSDTHLEIVDNRMIKKAKTDTFDSAASTAVFVNPPPPPPRSPSFQPSSRASMMSGNSGASNMSYIRSPLDLAPPPPPPLPPPLPMGRSGGERDMPASLLVSVPLPSTSQGLNLSAHAQMSSILMDGRNQSPHVYHQLPKQAAMEQAMQAHTPHPMAGRSTWGGLNVAYEMQQTDVNKSSVLMPPKEPIPSGSGTNTTVRNKKRAAMAAVSIINNPPPPPAPLKTAPSQTLSNTRREPRTPLLNQDSTKESPPNSPNSERQKKVDTKVGMSMAAPHMLGNELNPESGAAARLQEQLSAELAAHAVAGTGGNSMVPPPLLNKATQSIMSGSCVRAGTSSAQSLDQLLERQWEQGSQFLMEQAQHFDIASLLSCLHQLRTENVRLEEHVNNLLQRRDHLLAVNARLAIPLTTATPAEPSRCTRETVPPPRPPPGPVRSETITSERSHQLIMREVQQKPS